MCSSDLQHFAHLVEVVAANTTDEVREVLTLSTAAAGPLVHVTTDRPVYRPGEPVFARAVVLDRVTLLPLATRWPIRAQLLDAKDAPVAVQADTGNEVGVASFAFTVPAESAGGTHRVEVSSPAGAFAPESVEVVVRPFQTPRLAKQVVLDRKSYAPGARGSAAVSAERLGTGGGAAGAMATGSLVVDGTTVSSEKKALDAHGKATFRFTVPVGVEQGAARFVAVIDDGDDIVPIFIEGGGLTWYSGPDGPWRLYDYKPSGGELEELAKVVTAIRERERERQEARRKSQ